MKIKYILFFLVILNSSRSYSQTRPEFFDLNRANNLSKVSSSNPAGNSITDIITIGDTIWIGTGRGLSVSFDRGENWTNFYRHEAFGTESISAVGYYNGTVWAATAHSFERDGQSIQEGSGIRFTTNNGETWRAVPQPVDDPGDSALIYGINDGVNLPAVRALPVTVTPQNLTFDIAFTPGTIWITSWAGGLRKAAIGNLINDPLSIWERVLLPSDNLNEISPDDTIRFSLQVQAGKFGPESYYNHVVFSVEAINDSTIYAGTADGINKSTDGGISWRKFNHQNQDNSISGNFVTALEFDQSNNTLWAATLRANDQNEFYGASSSSDGGENWKTHLAGERVRGFGFKSGSVIAATDNGAFRKRNNDVNWILPTAIIDEQSKLSLLTNTFYSASSQGNDVWLGSADGLAKLNELSGLMWSGSWKIYFASQPLTSKNETYAYPNPFSPKQEFLKIKYSTGGANSSVTIRVFDFAMNYVRTVVQNVDRGQPVHAVDERGNDNNGVIDVWDGKDDNGNIVPNGVYFYRVEVGSGEPLYGKILVIQ